MLWTRASATAYARDSMEVYYDESERLSCFEVLRASFVLPSMSVKRKVTMPVGRLFIFFL
jgi:hypothetical protein